MQHRALCITTSHVYTYITIHPHQSHTHGVHITNSCIQHGFVSYGIRTLHNPRIHMSSYHNSCIQRGFVSYGIRTPTFMHSYEFISQFMHSTWDHIIRHTHTIAIHAFIWVHIIQPGSRTQLISHHIIIACTDESKNFMFEPRTPNSTRKPNFFVLTKFLLCPNHVRAKSPKFWI